MVWSGGRPGLSRFRFVLAGGATTSICWDRGMMGWGLCGVHAVYMPGVSSRSAVAAACVSVSAAPIRAGNWAAGGGGRGLCDVGGVIGQSRKDCGHAQQVCRVCGPGGRRCMAARAPPKLAQRTHAATSHKRPSARVRLHPHAGTGGHLLRRRRPVRGRRGGRRGGRRALGAAEEAEDGEASDVDGRLGQLGLA